MATKEQRGEAYLQGRKAGKSGADGACPYTLDSESPIDFVDMSQAWWIGFASGEREYLSLQRNSLLVLASEACFVLRKCETVLLHSSESVSGVPTVPLLQSLRFVVERLEGKILSQC
jgi:hypothetical protein